MVETIESAASVTSPFDQQILRRQVLVPSSKADSVRLTSENEAGRAADPATYIDTASERPALRTDGAGAMMTQMVARATEIASVEYNVAH